MIIVFQIGNDLNLVNWCQKMHEVDINIYNRLSNNVLTHNDFNYIH